MKKLIVLSFTLFMTIGLFAQGPFTGFLKPSKMLGGDYALRADGSEREWYFRPTVSVTGYRYDYIKEDKKFVGSSFSGFGMGISYEHYIQNANGELAKNFGFNALVMFDVTQNEGVGIAGTIEVLGFASFGPGYDLTNKNFFLLANAIWTF